jgi:hypothetical protein
MACWRRSADASVFVTVKTQLVRRQADCQATSSACCRGKVHLAPPFVYQGDGDAGGHP